MRKKCFIGIMVALFVCFIATSCTKRNFGDTAQEDDFGLNFKAVVMGDKSINPLQDWSTVASIPVEVSIDYGSNQSRTVYIYQTPPLIDNNAAYIGMARLSPGATKTLCVIKPAQVGLLLSRPDGQRRQHPPHHGIGQLDGQQQGPAPVFIYRGYHGRSEAQLQ